MELNLNSITTIEYNTIGLIYRESEDEVLKRKAIAFLLTVLLAIPISGFCFMLIESSSIREVPGLIVFASMFVTPVILLYGVPVSILSDKMSDRFIGVKRVLFALFIHLFLGISFPFFFILIADSRSILTNYNGGDLYVLAASALASILFFGMDETLRMFQAE